MVNKINLNGIPIKVSYKSAYRMPSTSHYGEIDYILGEIVLNSEVSREQKEMTLLHEIIHGLDNLHKYGLTEEVVTSLSAALYGTMKLNPKLFTMDIGKD